MNELIEAGLDVDGKFGNLTEAAVERYQESKGLEPDGEVGPLTWAAILEDLEAEINGGATTPTTAESDSSLWLSQMDEAVRLELLAIFFADTFSPESIARQINAHINDGHTFEEAVRLIQNANPYSHELRSDLQKVLVAFEYFALAITRVVGPLEDSAQVVYLISTGLSFEQALAAVQAPEPVEVPDLEVLPEIELPAPTVGGTDVEQIRELAQDVILSESSLHRFRDLSAALLLIARIDPSGEHFSIAPKDLVALVEFESEVASNRTALDERFDDATDSRRQNFEQLVAVVSRIIDEAHVEILSLIHI